MAANFFKLKKGLTLDPQTQYGALDPAGNDGDIYYNSVLGKFRKYESGTWTDMDTSGGSGGSSWVAAKVSILLGASNRVITFASAQPDTSYIVLAQMENTVDASPLFQQVEVTTKSNSGFTASWNMPTDSANYNIVYIVPSKTFVLGEKAITNATTTVTAVPVMPNTSLNNGLMMAIQNTTDLTPQFQVPILYQRIEASNEVGSIIATAASATIPGFQYCAGQSVLRADYPDLFNKIGTAFGAADGTHFNVPDFQGRFLRGVDGPGSRDADRSTRTAMFPGGNTGAGVGSVQGHAFQTHSHTITDVQHNHTITVYFDPAIQGSVTGGRDPSAGVQNPAGGTINPAFSGITGTNSTGATGAFQPQASTGETRPHNAYVHFHIKDSNTSSFSVRWNTPVDSGNYILANVIKATSEVAINNGATSVTVSHPVGYGSSDYAVIAMIQNKVDATPLFQPMVITAKTSTTFTASWSLPTDSINYVLSYYAISYA